MGAEFSSKRVQGHLQAEPALADVGEVDGDRIEVEAAGESERADGKPFLLPRSRAAELRKTFAKPGRFDRDVARAENARFDLGAGKHAVVQIDDGVSVFDMKLDSGEFEIVRQQIVKDSPGETLGRGRRLRISPDVHGDCFSREGAEETAARSIEEGGEIQIEFDPGGFDHDTKRGVRLAGDLELVHDHRTPERRLDSFELNAQSFLPRGARDP